MGNMTKNPREQRDLFEFPMVGQTAPASAKKDQNCSTGWGKRENNKTKRSNDVMSILFSFEDNTKFTFRYMEFRCLFG